MSTAPVVPAPPALRRPPPRPGDEPFRRLIENAHDLVQVLDGAGRIAYTGPSVRRLLGYRPEELAGLDPRAYLHPDDLAAVRGAVQRALAEPGTVQSLRYRIRHRDGEWRVLEAFGSAIPTSAADGLEVVINARDVTEASRMEEALRRSEERFRSVIHHAPDLLALVDVHRRIRFINPGVAMVLGYGAADLVGRDCFELVHPGDRAATMRVFEGAVGRPGLRIDAALRFARRDGAWRHLEVLAVTLSAESAEPGVLVSARDVTERREAELALERALAEAGRAREEALAAERRASLLAEVSGLLAASLDSSTGLAQLGRLLVPALAGACAPLLRQDERLVAVGAAGGGAAAAALDHVVGSLNARRGDLQWARAEPTTVSIRRVGRTGDAASAACRALLVPMRSASRLLGCLVVVREPGAACFAEPEVRLLAEVACRAALAVENARHLAEAQLAIAARDRMLAVTAHDLRNPLAVATMYADSLDASLPHGTGAEPREAVSGILACCERMQQMIDGLGDVARVQEGVFHLDPAETPIGDLFRDAEAMLRPLALARGIDLRFDADPGPAAGTLACDGGRILQVVSNLVGNAIRHTPESGRVTVAWRLDVAGLRVSVRDTGPGIAADHLPRLFVAFWQARGADRAGLGLGLWICRAIVDGHGGRIWVESSEGEGAAFHFVVPRPDPTL
jgi:PAS domain S-box-containing protein